MATKFWLLKAEPDSRMVSGKDVKFSVDDFEAAKTTPWEGVRNPEARNLLKEMRVGQKALFYHSNCKNPGIAAFAEVSKEAYPDHTAWDPSHPYFDKKTDPAAAQATPKWFMCDLTFTSRAKHFVPLALLKYLATLPAPPKELEYISEDGLRALKIMDLIGRGRLSVQRVDQAAFDAITLLAENGGWDDLPYTIGTKRPVKVVSYNEDDVDEEEEEPPKSARKAKAKAKPKAKSKADWDEAESESDFGADDDDEDGDYGSKSKKQAGKRKAKKEPDTDYRSPSRRKSVR